MPRPLQFIVVLSVLVALGWFSNYAYHEVDKSDSGELRQEVARLKALDEGHSKQMTDAREQYKKEISAKHQALVEMFPNDVERINALFFSSAEKAEENKKATEPAVVKGGH